MKPARHAQQTSDGVDWPLGGLLSIHNSVAPADKDISTRWKGKEMKKDRRASLLRKY